MALTTNTHLVWGKRKSKAISLFPPWDFMAFLGWNWPYRKLAAYVFQRLISRYHLGKWSVVFTLVGVKNIEYILWENCWVFNVESGGKYSYRCAWNVDFIVSVLFRPPVNKTFIFTLAFGITIGFSFAYILMATCSLEEFPFFPSRYIICWTMVTCKEAAVWWAWLCRRIPLLLHW